MSNDPAADLIREISEHTAGKPSTANIGEAMFDALGGAQGLAERCRKVLDQMIADGNPQAVSLLKVMLGCVKDFADHTNQVHPIDSMSEEDLAATLRHVTSLTGNMRTKKASGLHPDLEANIAAFQAIDLPQTVMDPDEP